MKKYILEKIIKQDKGQVCPNIKIGVVIMDVY